MQKRFNKIRKPFLLSTALAETYLELMLPKTTVLGKNAWDWENATQALNTPQSLLAYGVNRCKRLSSWETAEVVDEMMAKSEAEVVPERLHHLLGLIDCRVQ